MNVNVVPKTLSELAKQYKAECFARIVILKEARIESIQSGGNQMGEQIASINMQIDHWLKTIREIEAALEAAK